MTTSSLRSTIISAVAVGALGGCLEVPVSDLGGIYERAAQAPDLPLDPRNPVVVIPGILGSRLEDEDSGRLVWGAFADGYAHPHRSSGAQLIGVPMLPGRPLSERLDGVRATGALETLRVRLFGLPFGIAAYHGLLLALGVGGYRDQQLGLKGAIDYGDEHYTCFQFAYDWRRGVDENARLLAEFLREKRAYIQAEHLRRTGRERENLRFDIVAHSMGGLLTRYFLRYGGAPPPADNPIPDWSGAEWVERALLVGTPNAGSIGAFDSLVNGMKLGPFLPRYPAALIGTMPSVYQLLPRERHGAWRVAGDEDTSLGGLGQAELWERMGWGLLDPDEDRTLQRLLPDVDDPDERRAIARDHLEHCLEQARRVQAALDVPAAPPPELELILFAGDSQSTAQRVLVDLDSGAVSISAYAPGDGSVLRSSALMDERQDGNWAPRLRSPIHWARVSFFFADHLELTRDPAFLDNLLYLLLEEPRRGDAAFLASNPSASDLR